MNRVVLRLWLISSVIWVAAVIWNADREKAFWWNENQRTTTKETISFAEAFGPTSKPPHLSLAEIPYPTALGPPVVILILLGALGWAFAPIRQR